MKLVLRDFAGLTAKRPSIHYAVVLLLLALSCAWQAHAGDSNTIPLTSPRSVQVRFQGEDAVVRALASAHATPLSLATGDFDMDGIGDRAAGYASADGARVAIFRRTLAPSPPQGKEVFCAVAPPK